MKKKSLNTMKVRKNVETITAQNSQNHQSKSIEKRVYDPVKKEWVGSSLLCNVYVKMPTDWPSECYKHLGFECIFHAEEELNGEKDKCIVMSVAERDFKSAAKCMRNFLRNFNCLDEELTARNAWILKNAMNVFPEEWGNGEGTMWCVSPNLWKQSDSSVQLNNIGGR